MKKKVAVIGSTGMLGSMVYNVLKNECDLLLTYRDSKLLSRLNHMYGGVDKHKTIKIDLNKLYEEYLTSNDWKSKSIELSKVMDCLKDYEFIINCTGIIKRAIHINPGLSLFVNGAFPHILSRFFKNALVHITTDCVFDGKSYAPYDENSTKNPTDLYGLSKSLGEPEESLVLRTSFIGPELNGKSSLLEWLIANKGNEVVGFSNHIWNGITTKEFGNACLKIISRRKEYPSNGVYHVFSEAITKYELLVKLNEKYKLNCVIKKRKVEPIDRRLSTIYKLNRKLDIKGFNAMLKEL